MRLRWTLCAAALLSAAGARRSDQDFEFDDDAAAQDLSDNSLGGGRARRPQRFVYDPHNSLCGALRCRPRELCLLRDARTALCAARKDVLRKGDVIMSGGGGGGGGADSADSGLETADDVFYESGGGGGGATVAGEDAPDRCVGCGGVAGGAGGAGGASGFLCGSDNRTYSSLCRLDLHNCVRRRAAPVQLACRGFCPCAPPAPRRRPAPALREWRRRVEPAARDDADVPAPAQRAVRRRPTGAAGCALDKMANRLLDWFSVLMEEARPRAEGADGAGFPRSCKPEVRWMFAHLDADGDGRLSAGELWALRHAERERCLRPLLARCGPAPARAAWCACLARAARPCEALARAHAADAARGGYAPACDARGYYAPRQCHAALAVCWCVDKHGVERAGSRTRGEPDCGAGAGPGPGGPPADDEDGAGAGSGDAEPRY